MGGVCSRRGIEDKDIFVFDFGENNWNLEYFCVDGRIISKYIMNKETRGCGLNFLWLRIGNSSYEHGNKPSSSIKCGEIIDWLIDYQFLKTKFSS
jgi:hypothetical protein